MAEERRPSMVTFQDTEDPHEIQDVPERKETAVEEYRRYGLGSIEETQQDTKDEASPTEVEEEKSTIAPRSRRSTLDIASRAASMELDSDQFDAMISEVYSNLVEEDPRYRKRALEAYDESLNMPEEEVEDVGLVNRRAPPNIFARKKSHDLVKDPALKNNPLRGRLIAMLTTSSVLLFVFLQALVLNKTYYGQTLVPYSENGMVGPSGLVLYELGGLNTNAIRDGEIYRLFWAAWMHSGWLHIIFNVLSQMQFFFMYEPDWGFWRAFLVFWIAGISGNLLSSVLDPCKTTVGSSGGLFGLMGAMVPYCIEYWKTIPRPGTILFFTFIILGISILTGFTGNTDNWAHIGGLLSGILFGMGTITRLSAIEDWYRKRVQHHPHEIEGETKKTIKRFHAQKTISKAFKPECSAGKSEWTVRICCFLLLIAAWIALFLLLLEFYDTYSPIGHVTYTGISKCICCYVNVNATEHPREDQVPFYCFPDEIKFHGWKSSWGEFCEFNLDYLAEHGHEYPMIDPVGRIVT